MENVFLDHDHGEREDLPVDLPLLLFLGNFCRNKEHNKGGHFEQLERLLPSFRTLRSFLGRFYRMSKLVFYKGILFFNSL